MDRISHFVMEVLQLLIKLGTVIVAALVAIELWLRAQLAHLGLPPVIETVIMLAVAALLILGSLRLFGGLLRIIVVLILTLLALHILLPVMPR